MRPGEAPLDWNVAQLDGGNLTIDKGMGLE